MISDDQQCIVADITEAPHSQQQAQQQEQREQQEEEAHCASEKQNSTSSSVPAAAAATTVAVQPRSSFPRQRRKHNLKSGWEQLPAPAPPAKSWQPAALNAAAVVKGTIQRIYYVDDKDFQIAALKV